MSNAPEKTETDSDLAKAIRHCLGTSEYAAAGSAYGSENLTTAVDRLAMAIEDYRSGCPEVLDKIGGEIQSQLGNIALAISSAASAIGDLADAIRETQ